MSDTDNTAEPAESAVDPRPPANVPQPSIGRVIHVRIGGGDTIRPATISAVDEQGWVTAHVFVIPGVDCALGDPPVAVFQHLSYWAPAPYVSLAPSWFWPAINAPKPQL